MEVQTGADSTEYGELGKKIHGVLIKRYSKVRLKLSCGRIGTGLTLARKQVGSKDTSPTQLALLINYCFFRAPGRLLPWSLS